MVSALGLVGLTIIILVNTAITALMTRFFRVRLDTDWGTVIYTALLVPIVLFLSLLVLSGGLGLGSDLGSRETVVGLTILLPLLLGITFDFFWMPAPDDVDVPDRRSRRSP